jgi:hypothetical protein
MEEFSRWTADKEAELKEFLTVDLKHEAFSLATEQRNVSLTKMVFRIYQLKDDKELFVERLRTLISRRDYKEVSIDCVLTFRTLNIVRISIIKCGARSSVVVKALFYKPEGRGFDSR